MVLIQVSKKKQILDLASRLSNAFLGSSRPAVAAPTPVAAAKPVASPKAALPAIPVATSPTSVVQKPAVPSRPTLSDNSTTGAKKLPNRPVSMQIKVPMVWMVVRMQ